MRHGGQRQVLARERRHGRTPDRDDDVVGGQRLPGCPDGADPAAGDVDGGDRGATDEGGASTGGAVLEGRGDHVGSGGAVVEHPGG